MLASALGLHVGVIGVGRIGVFHVRTLLRDEGVSRLTLADADLERAEQVASELSVSAAEGPEDLLNRRIDALVIATATTGHAPMLRLAAAAKVPTFCEKPVALDRATMDELVEVVRRAGVLVQIGFQRRFDAGYRAGRALRPPRLRRPARAVRYRRQHRRRRRRPEPASVGRAWRAAASRQGLPELPRPLRAGLPERARRLRRLRPGRRRQRLHPRGGA